MSINDLTDVNINAIQDGQTLVWDSNTLQFNPANTNLSIEIDKLTRQFIAFGEAQAASMGIPMVAKNPLLGQAKLPGFASGGLVPGSGNGDSVFAMLTPGE